ncbi:hypothetical protein [Haladaptatus caseinilyticus]|uniref:hypothetical protein n=1 Tax=Haladaptatus caseinilyticus TaxID=2993314 RepID=UPI00224B66A5|nr:hypothetical protein [Haladaptatus caseinilyticus]
MAPDRQIETKTNRRSYLKLAGIAAGSTAMVGKSVAAPSDLEDKYETVIDVTDEGADPTGNESITPIIEELAGSDTLLKFPSGDYYIDKRIRVTGCNNFGMVGNDATLIPAPFDEFDDSGDWNYKLFRLGVDYDPVTDLRVENFTVDMSRDNTGVRVIDAAADDGMIVRDIEVVGRHDTGAWGPGRFVITSAEGTGLVERFSAPDGAAATENAPGDKLEWGPTGILCNTNEGTITFRDCVLGSFPDHGLYASNGAGSVHIEGGRYQNSLGANVRIGGIDSYIEDTTIVVDQQDGFGRSQQGLRFENGEKVVATNVDIQSNVSDSPPVWIDDSASQSRLEDSTVTVRTDGTTPAVTVRSGTGTTVLQRCDITHETGGGSAVKIKEGGGRVKLLDTSITGEAAANGTYSAIYNDRDDSLFAGLTVDHGGDSGRHALTNTAAGCTIQGGTYVSESHAVVEGGNGTLIEGITARSRSGKPGLQILESTENLTMRNNDIEGGVEDER